MRTVHILNPAAGQGGGQDRGRQQEGNDPSLFHGRSPLLRKFSFYLYITSESENGQVFSKKSKLVEIFLLCFIKNPQALRSACGVVMLRFALPHTIYRSAYDAAPGSPHSPFSRLPSRLSLLE